LPNFLAFDLRTWFRILGSNRRVRSRRSIRNKQLA